MSEQFSIYLETIAALKPDRRTARGCLCPPRRAASRRYENIGVTAENPQDLFVGRLCKYRTCPFDVPLSVIQSGSIDELNYLGKLLEMQRDEDKAKFAAAVTLGEYAGNLKDLINLAQTLTAIGFIPPSKAKKITATI